MSKRGKQAVAINSGSKKQNKHKRENKKKEEK